MGAAGIVGLVMRAGHDEHRLAGFEGLGQGADSTLVNDGGGVGEEVGVGDVLRGAELRGEDAAGLAVGQNAGEEDGASAQFFDCSGGDGIEISRGKDGGGAQREDDRGLAHFQKFCNLRGKV